MLVSLAVLDRIHSARWFLNRLAGVSSIAG